MAYENAADLPFSDEALKQLSQALRLFVSTWETERHESLQRAIARICTQAHDAHLGPERMLVAVKTAWGHAIDSQRVDPDRARSACDRVLGYCLEAYYAQPE